MNCGDVVREADRES